MEDKRINYVFLFGAGASVNCGDIYPKSPPVGAHLFDVLRNNCKSWASLPINLKEIFNRSFEDGMEEVWNKYSTALSPLLREMAMFFAQFRIIPTHKCLYQILYNELVRKNVIGQVAWSSLKL